MIGRRIQTIADLRRVRVRCGGRLVADHERLWARHQTVSASEHVAAPRALRSDRLGRLRPAPAGAAGEQVQRSLSDDDAALG